MEQERTYCIAGSSKGPAKAGERQLGQLGALCQGEGKEGFPVGTGGVGEYGWVLHLVLESLLLGLVEVLELTQLAGMEGQHGGFPGMVGSGELIFFCFLPVELLLLLVRGEALDSGSCWERAPQGRPLCCISAIQIMQGSPLQAREVELLLLLSGAKNCLLVKPVLL